MYKSRLGDLGLEDMYARQRAASTDLNKEAIRQERSSAIEGGQATPMSGALMGASVGSLGGPIGAGIGAAVGGLAGGVMDFQNRKKNKQSTGKALAGTWWDATNPANLLKGSNPQQAASLGARMGSMSSAKAPSDSVLDASVGGDTGLARTNEGVFDTSTGMSLGKSGEWSYAAPHTEFAPAMSSPSAFDMQVPDYRSPGTQNMLGSSSAMGPPDPTDEQPLPSMYEADDMGVYGGDYNTTPDEYSDYSETAAPAHRSRRKRPDEWGR